jgi:hypothetical protein
MASLSPFRSLSSERRLALITHALTQHKGARAKYIQRLVARGGGFRAASLQSWPSERLAKEVLRLNAQDTFDELELLQLLYVDLEPAIQITFLEACGVAHENGVIDETLEAPYTTAEAVARGAAAVIAAHGEDAFPYLRALERYNLAGWPGLDTVLANTPDA